MSEAPERIWAQDAEPAECHYTGGGWWDDECGSTQYPHMVEYIRADLSDAAIAGAYEAAAEAVENADDHNPYDFHYDLEAGKSAAFSEGIEEALKAVRALTPPDALAARDAHTARAVEALEAQLAEAVEALEASREAHCGLAEFFLHKPRATRKECSGTFTDSQNARLAIDRALAKIKGAEG